MWYLTFKDINFSICRFSLDLLLEMDMHGKNKVPNKSSVNEEWTYESYVAGW